MPNRLADATSPYLRQHAHNPVDWYPWGPEALQRARELDRPILLSVGYAACHWCHVMERESFSDDRTATYMNQAFVCIKVDREERPDLDTLYMTAVQAFTGGHGGWPMTVFLTPDGRPYLAGTYFPPEPARGRPSFRMVMERAGQLYHHDRERLDQLAARVVQAIETSEAVPALTRGRPKDWLSAVVEAATATFDDVNGGFGGAPKFPPHGELAALLASWHRRPDEGVLTMVTETLDAMARGGMYDHIGGGFARYSTDAHWRVPHFEKMLYDNALLVPVYLDAATVTGRLWFERVARDTLDYVARDLTGPEGGFFASEDADSEGHEGALYVWTPRQLVEVLGEHDGAFAARALSVTDHGTFERGTSVLRIEGDPTCHPEMARLERCVVALSRARGERVRPGLDAKRITAWNALMIRAFARGATQLDSPAYLERASVAAHFLLTRATVDGRLMRTWSEGAAQHLGYLDDHAFFVLALVELWEASFDPRWLHEAIALAERTLELFWDEQSGTCFYTGHDAELLVARPRKLVGGAEPSGNGVLAWALARLDVLCSRPDLGDRADRILEAFAPLAADHPQAIGLEAIAHALRTGPVQQLGITTERPDRLLPWLRALLPHRADPFRVIAVSGYAQPVVPWLAGRGEPGPTRAWICEGGTCRLPAETPAELGSALTRRAPSSTQ